MATIPDCRAALEAIARRLPTANTFALRAKLTAEIIAVVAEMHRRAPTRKASVRARPMTAALKAKARAMAAEHPDVPIREIGRRLHIDGGRVSEAVAGRRT